MFLKKERNCGCGGNQYPAYPTYPNVMPMNQGMINPMMNQNMMYNQGFPMTNQGMAMPNNIVMPTSPSINTMNTDYSTLANQVNNLERRVSRIEGILNNSNTMTPKYSESNYYMV